MIRPNLRAGRAAFRHRLIMSTALVGTLLSGYARSVYAGDCTGAAGTYSCSGVANSASDTEISLSGTPLTVTTESGFGVDTSVTGGNAIVLSGTDGTTFTDNYGSSITGYGTGIVANNDGSGALSVSASGSVTGSTEWGIWTQGGVSGTGLTVSAADVTGYQGGIYARNFGGGVLSVSSSGTVTSSAGDGIYAWNRTYGTDLSVDAVNVDADGIGIVAHNDGTGVTTVTTSGTISAGSGAKGIYAYNRSTATDLTVVSTGDVSGGTTGIYAINRGTGLLSVTTGGSVTGSTTVGISVYGFGTDISVNASGDVSGVETAISARNIGTGAVSVITTGAVTSSGGYGIFAWNETSGTDVSVDASGDVTSASVGISAVSYGTGSISITASGDVYSRYSHGITVDQLGAGDISVTTSGTVTANGGRGIFAYGDAGTTGISIDAGGDVNGTSIGIDVQNKGTGASTVVAGGSVSGGTLAGIRVRNSATTTGLTIDAYNTTGNAYGVYANNQGSGALSITTGGAVTGTTGKGIYAYNGPSGTDLIVEASGDVTGQKTGIDADNHGTGVLSITASGTTTASTYDGIYAINYGSDLTVDAYNVSGGKSGVAAYNFGSGATTITTSGSVTGGTRAGILAFSGGTDLAIVASGNVVGETAGIYAYNDGSGALSITTGGSVTGVDYGIRAKNNGGDLTIVSTGAVYSDALGIQAIDSGNGVLSITASGGITAGGEGIYAVSSTAGTANGDGNSLVISATDVTGWNGIWATNNGEGALSITTAGLVTATNDRGIMGINQGAGTNLIVNAADVTASNSAIAVRNEGTGFLSVTSTGTLESASKNGVYAFNKASGTDLTIDVVNAYGDREGIYAKNEGTGAISVTSSGTVVSSTRSGIWADNSSAGTDLSVEASNVYGAWHGIDARNYGTGALSIATSGTVEGASSAGIYAHTSNSGSGLSVTATGDVSGGASGIAAFHLGSGSLSVTTSGSVTGNAYYGIDAFNYLSGADLSIHASGDVTGIRRGISALNYGTGATSVISTASVTATAGDGVYAWNEATGTDLTIDAADVYGAATGIWAKNMGSGAVSVSASGTVTGATANGIYIYNSPSGGGVTVQVADVTAADAAIDVKNRGNGDVSITATGTVTSTASDGIDVYTRNSGVYDLTIDVADVSGYSDGINARNDSGGAMSITVSGTVSGDKVYGIYALNGSSATDLTVTVGETSSYVSGLYPYGGLYGATANASNVYGREAGISVFNMGSGATTITVAGNVTAHDPDGAFGYEGIRVRAYGTDLTIVASGDVSGDRTGIYAENEGTGAISITTSGAVTGTGANGIYALSWNAGGGIVLDVNDVSGYDDAIRAVQTSGASGDVSITARGTVTSSTAAGIYVGNSASGSTTGIIVTSGALVEGAYAGINVQNDPVIVNYGTIQNLDGLSTSLAINVSGDATEVDNHGLVTGVLALEDADDTFNNYSDGTWNTAGGTNDFGGAGTDNDVVNNYGVIWAASAGAGSAVSTFFDNLETFNSFSGGNLTMSNDVAGDITTISGDFVSNGGTLSIDTVLGDDASLTDRLVVEGDVLLGTGATLIAVNNVGGLGALTTGDGIEVVEVGGTSDADAFGLASTVSAGAYTYQLYQGGLAGGDQNWYLRSSGYSPTVVPAEVLPQVLLGLNKLSTLFQRKGERNWYGSSSSFKDDYDLITGGLFGTNLFDEGVGFWSTIEGNYAHQQFNSSTSGSHVDTSMWRVRMGADALAYSHQAERLITGLSVEYTEAKSRPGNSQYDTSVDTTGYGLNATATWYGQKFYADAVGKVARYDNDVYLPSSGTEISGIRGWGYSASAESGFYVDGGNRWVLIPQAQLSYSWINIPTYYDSASKPFSLDGGDSLVLRTGLAAEKKLSWQRDNGQVNRLAVRGIGNIYHEFRGDTQVDANGTTLASSVDPWTAEIGLGGTYNGFGDDFSVYLEATGATGLDHFGESYSVGVNFGFLAKF